LNSSKCSITTGELRILPKLHGEIQSTIDATHFYIPESVSVIANHEIPLIKAMPPEEVKRLEVKSKVMTPSQNLDMDSLFHIRKVSMRQTNH
jgi:hypothetical protein